MTSLAAVLPSVGDDQSTGLLNELAKNPRIQAIATTASDAGTKQSEKAQTLGAANLRSAAAVIEVLRWFESSSSSHLLWLLSPNIELSEIGVQRLMQAAADSNAAILY